MAPEKSSTSQNFCEWKLSKSNTPTKFLLHLGSIKKCSIPIASCSEAVKRARSTCQTETQECTTPCITLGIEVNLENSAKFTFYG